MRVESNLFTKKGWAIISKIILLSELIIMFC